MIYAILKELVRPLPLVFLIHGLLLVALWRSGRRGSNGEGNPARRWRMRAVLGSYVLVYLACTELVGSTLMRWLEGPYQPLANRPAKVAAIVVLGGGGSPSHPARHRPELSEESIDRCLEAAEMYHDGPPCPVIVTGTQPGAGAEFPPHAETMRDLLAQLGVDPVDLWVEPRALNTFENATETKALLRARGLEGRTLLLVTQASHMRRAMACFRKQALDVVAAPCRPVGGGFTGSLEFFLPSPGGVRLTRTAWNEWLGLLWYAIQGRV